MKKTCSRCSGVFDIEYFGWRYKRKKKVVQPYCPECSKAYRREHYYGNRAAYKRRAKVRTAAFRKQSRAFLADFLRTHPCVDCGTNDLRVLEFDHVRGRKVKGVCAMLDHSIETIKVEIAKCEVRCKNCHAIATGKRRKVWWTQL